MKAARKLRGLQQPQSLMEFVRQFLTPQVWKQARQAVPPRRRQPRWDLQPLVSVKTAAKFYRCRWRNEGLFRTYKRTLKKFKLASRSVKLIHHELEGSLLALQILLAHADLALRAHDATGEIAISPRNVLIQIRKEINRDSANHRRIPTYARRLDKCRAETRRQTSPKASREWPRRKPHKAPAPPKFLTMREDQKALLQQYIGAA